MSRQDTLLLLLALSLPVLSSCIEPSRPQTVIHGSLVGHDGNPMLKAHVHLTARSASGESWDTVLATAEARHDGSFELRTGETGALFLRFTGVDHANHQVPLVIEEPMDLELNARLATRGYLDDLSHLRVTGDFNDFSPHSGKVMERQPDSTYAVTFEVASDTLAYQLIGLASGGPTSGTQAEDFVYDGARDYRSVVLPTDGRITITLDPEQLVRSEVAPEVRFADPHSIPARFARMVAEMDERVDAIGRARTAARQAGDSFHFDGSADVADLSERIAGETEPLLRQVLLLDLLNVARVTRELDPALARLALGELATSRVWTYQPFLISASFLINDLIALAVELSDTPESTAAELGQLPSGTSRYTEYVGRVVERHPDAFVRASTLYGAIRMAHEAEQVIRAERYYQRLATDYPDFWLLPVIKSRWAPQRNIRVGEIIPEFAFLSLDDPNVTYTREGLLGTVYLIDFWATWCGPCIGEFPTLHELYGQYQARGFEILSVSLDDSPDLVAEFRGKTWGMPWLNTFLGPDFEVEAAKRFDVSFLPRPILVDRGGKIVAYDHDAKGTGLRERLVQIFGPAE